MKKLKSYFIIVGLSIIWLTCQSCSNEDNQIQTSNKRQIQISNEGNQFEYWLNQDRHNSNGETISVIVDKGTQITICSVVRVIDGVIIIPNVQVYQDSKVMSIRQVNKGLFWYEVN